MRLRARHQHDGTWLESELLRRAWTYQDLAKHAGVNRMTIYFLLHPGEYGRERKRRNGTVLPCTAWAISEALVRPEDTIEDIFERCFEVVS
jgi:DNA-binding XRE family transcriptional regulator